MKFLRALRGALVMCPAQAGLILLLAGLMGLAGAARAVPVANLYQATVPVASSQASDRSAAFTQALKNVMARIAGTDAVTSQPALSDTLNNAEPLVESYRYEQGPDDQDEIQVSFGAVGVNRALASAGIPVWGVNRPLMVVWAAVDTGANRTLVTPDSGDWSKAFNQAARTWGLPIVLPQYDSVDQQAVNLSEVWGQFMDNISQASRRYHADLVVAMRISGQPGQWNVSWQMQGGDVQDQGTSTADNPGDLISGVAKRWATELAKRYAVSAASVGNDQSVDLVIKGVNGLTDYAGVRQALQGMTPIQEVVPITITSDELVLRVKFAGELTVLQQYIALDHRFKAVPTDSQAYVPMPLVTSAPVTGATTPTSAPVGVTSGSAPSGNMTSAPAASPGMVEQNGSSAAMSDETGDSSAEGKNFSRLYPRLHYTWTGKASAPQQNKATGSTSAPAAAGTAQPINATGPLTMPTNQTSSPSGAASGSGQ